MPTQDQDLKDIVTLASDLTILINESINGFTFAEVADIIRLLTDLQVVIGDVPTLYEQYVELNDAARAELVAMIEAKVLFPKNVVAQTVVQKVLEALVAVSALVAVLKKK